MPVDTETMRAELFADLARLEAIDATESGDTDGIDEEIRDVRRQIESLEDDLDELERRRNSLHASKHPSLTARSHEGRVRQAIEILRSHGRVAAADKLAATLAKWAEKGARAS